MKRLICRGIAIWLIIAGLLSSIASFSGCGGRSLVTGTIPETATNTVVPEDIFVRIKNATKDIKTFEYVLKITTQIKRETEDMTYSLMTRGVMDRVNSSGKFEQQESQRGELNNSKIDGPFTGAKAVSYFIRGDAYFGDYDANGKSISWDKNSGDQAERCQIFAVMDEAGLQSSIIEKSTVNSIKLDDLQGTPCYLVEINPDINSLLDYARWKGMDVEANYQKLVDGVKKVTVEYWVTQDNVFLKKAYIYLETEITGEAPLYYSFETNILFAKVNEPVNIQLPPEANELTVENVQNRVWSEQPKVNTHEIYAEMTIIEKGISAGKEVNESISKTINGTFDMLNHRYGVEVITNIKGQSGNELLNTVIKDSYYVLNNVAYFGKSANNGNINWEIIPSPPQERLDRMADKTLIMGVLSNLLISSRVISVSSDILQGAECYVVELDPNHENLYDYITQIGEISIPVDHWEFQNCVKKASAKLWITKDKYYFKKAYVYMEAEVATKDQLHYDMEINMNFDKINELVDVQLPDQIKNN